MHERRHATGQLFAPPMNASAARMFRQFSGWGRDHRDVAATEQRISNGRPVAGNLNTRIRF